ncbi:MAG TPA: phosphate acyltransferase, partial [Anaerovoracaceae bacterium]|nr:phosphate acyltransferase [Anaerovoracaceae bacterium]
MDIIQELKKDIADPNTRIVYPEGEEPEILKTASRIKREGIAVPVLVGSTQSILKAAEALDIDLTGIGIIDPANDPVLDR